MLETGLDQALGLRRLFQPRFARVLPVVAGIDEPPGRAALALARELNALGHRCLIIDATRGELARRLGLAVRYELRHVELGDRTLADVVLQPQPDLRVLPAQRGLAQLAHDADRGGLARLARRLGTAEDWILIAADSQLAVPAAALAGGGEVAVACGQGAAGRTAAYAVIKSIVRATETHSFRLLADGPRAAEACRELDQVAQQFLQARVESGDCDPLTWSCARLQR